MTDIFISYSKADHALALKLSAFLEAEGWSVWWDKSLGAADLYRDEIMKQLAAARAVITIWSPNSIKSDWVRAEAGRAKADRKLIPVKTPDVAYADIPLPFGEMHTENIASTDLIRAAIVAQLAKPAVTPSTFWQITGLFRYNVLTWVGIVGSAITLFANLNGVLNVADWARELTTHWLDWNHLIWELAFAWTGVKLRRELILIASFTVFVTILVVGTNLSVRNAGWSDTSQNAAEKISKTSVFAVGIILYLAALRVVLLLAYLGLLDDDTWQALWKLLAWYFPWVICFTHLKIGCGFLSLHFCFPQWVKPCYFHLMRKRVAELTVLGLALQGGRAPGLRQFLCLHYMLFPIYYMGVVLFSPIRQLTRRLGFVVMGVITLLVLSDISQLDLHQYLQPPKVSENLVC